MTRTAHETVEAILKPVTRYSPSPKFLQNMDSDAEGEWVLLSDVLNALERAEELARRDR